MTAGDKRKVIAVAHSYFPADVRVRREAQALAEDGWVVDVVCLRQDGEAAAEQLDGVNVVRLPVGRRRSSRLRYLVEYASFLLLAFATVWRRARRQRYALAHVHTLPDFLVFAAAPARWCGAKLLLDLHEITPEFYQQKYGARDGHPVVRLLRWLEQASIRYADAVVTVNEPLKERFVARGTSPDKISIVMNAADERVFPVGSSVYLKGSEPEDPFALVYHGSLLPIYGLELAVRAIAAVRSRWPYRLILYGTGEGEAQIVATARSLRCEDRVEMRGPVPHEQVAGVLQAAGGGLVPTLPGPILDLSLSTKLLEMMCVGCPVIAADLPSYRRYLSHDTAVYFTAGDDGALASALNRFAIMTTDDRAALARRAVSAVRTLRWDTEKSHLQTLVERLASEGRR